VGGHGQETGPSGEGCFHSPWRRARHERLSENGRSLPVFMLGGE